MKVSCQTGTSYHQFTNSRFDEIKRIKVASPLSLKCPNYIHPNFVGLSKIVSDVFFFICSPLNPMGVTGNIFLIEIKVLQ